ncbi:MAG: TolC family protein [Rhodothermales bacterium]
MRMTRIIPLVFLVFVFSGCATVPRDAGLSDVLRDIETRSGFEAHYQPNWFAGEADSIIVKQLQTLLADTLTMDKAVQAALLNNRRLQATFASLGVARADLLQAGLFRNPVFGTHLGYPTEEDHAPDIELSLSFNFLDFFHAPLKKAVAASSFEEAKLRVTSEVLALTGEVMQAYFDVEVAAQLFELTGQVALSAKGSFEAARLLRDAGNLRAIDMYTEQSFYEQARIDLARAQMDIMNSREHLNQLLGLWGPDVAWETSGRLPAILDELPMMEMFEKQAVTASIDLALANQQTETLARRLGVVNATRLLPELSVGIGATREGSWEVGPEFGFPVPLFDQGQARKAGAVAVLQQEQANYYALGIEVRAASRMARAHLTTAHQTALQYRDVVVPLRNQISAEAQTLMNAMQIGVFQLIDARRQEIQAGKMYIESLRDYWRAYTNYQLLLQGKLPQGGVEMPVSATDMMPETSSGGH